MKFKLNECGWAVAQNPLVFEREFSDIEDLNIIHGCCLAAIGLQLKPEVAQLMRDRNLGDLVHG